jgi:hypothetical protein
VVKAVVTQVVLLMQAQVVVEIIIQQVKTEQITPVVAQGELLLEKETVVQV